MSFANLDDLKQRVRDWFARNDPDFTARLGDFVALAEGRIYWGGGRDESDPLFTEAVRCRAMEGTADIVITSGEGPLPERFLEHRVATWASPHSRKVVYRDPVAFWTSPEVDAAGSSSPSIYTVEGDVVRVAPSASGLLRMTSYQRFAALTNGTDTNWILANHPGILLHATMIEAGVWAKEAARTQTALQQYRAAVAGLNRVNLRSTYHGPLEPVFA